MTRFRLSRRAGEDLATIHGYIASQNQSAADRLIREFFHLFHLLAKNSAMGEQRSDLRPNLRIMSHANHAVCFYPMQDGIEVVTVLHGSRDIEALFRENTD